MDGPPGSVTISNTGSTTITAANTYSGGTTIAAGAAVHVNNTTGSGPASGMLSTAAATAGLGTTRRPPATA